MKKSQIQSSSVAAIILAASTMTSAGAAPREACAVLPLAQVRAIVGAPVDIFKPSSGTKTRGGHTDSSCVYMVGHFGGRGASLFLLSGSAADVAKSQQYYQKRGQEPSSIKGGVFVLASVSSNGTVDRSASQKLLAAALAKL